jgi:DNA-binding MarR family transcriptional regulator
LVERIRKQGDRRVALITLTQSGQKLGQTIPDPIEKKFIKQLADLEPEHLQILAMTMNQILTLTDRKGGEETFPQKDI